MAECHYCGRRFPLLYKVSAEDIQRENPPTLVAYQVACGECLNYLRAAAQLIPQQSSRQIVRNFSWMIPLSAVGLLTAAIVASFASFPGLGELGLSTRWIGTGAVIVGIMLLWNRSRDRYAFTHDLRWTINSKRVDLALSIIIAGIAVAILPTLFT